MTIDESPDPGRNDAQEPLRNAKPSRRRWRWIGLLAVMVVAAGAYYVLAMRASGSAPVAAPSADRTARPVPVVVGPVGVGDVRVSLTGLGSVTPLNTVTVHSRVDGQLMRVGFQEGQLVNTGDLLAEIDPRPFQAQLAQAEGQLERDGALLDNARIDLDRYRVLYQQDSIPQQQLSTQESLVRQYEGAVKNDQGQVDNAKVQLAYCHITAPLGGRVGLRLMDPGNIVHAADAGGLVVITQLQPIAVVFTLAEDSIPAVLDKLNHGARLTVEAYDREERHKLATGSLLTIDNQVDPSTGTVKLKAVFPNTDNRLFASQFVNAHLLLDVKRGTTVVPAAAIQQSARGPFVYVVTPDRKAVVRQVTVGVTDGDRVAVDKGLAVGDRVVVDGADRLRDGAPVALDSKAGS